MQKESYRIVEENGFYMLRDQIGQLISPCFKTPEVVEMWASNRGVMTYTPEEFSLDIK